MAPASAIDNGIGATAAGGSVGGGYGGGYGGGIENPLHQSRHLLDDSVIEDKPSSDATSTGSSEGVIGIENDGSGCGSDLSQQHGMGFQGCVRRKTVLKDGRKPAVASWQRYWLQIWANSLVYFPPKSFKG